VICTEDEVLVLVTSDEFNIWTSRLFSLVRRWRS
jgi:hypothetical protein